VHAWPASCRDAVCDDSADAAVEVANLLADLHRAGLDPYVLAGGRQIVELEDQIVYRRVDGLSLRTEISDVCGQAGALFGVALLEIS
jgi:hypothetical protein